jgi:diguanylate cyclase (GGDEF)-like protein/PAS domain S-box-containing protein
MMRLSRPIHEASVKHPAASKKHTIAAVRRHRPLMMFCAGTLLVLCAGIAIGARSLIGSFEQLETAAELQKAEQVDRAFAADLNQLAISNRDYAEFDDAAEFVGNRNHKFIATNLLAETLVGLHVDLVWIVDARGQEVYSGYLDRTSGRVLTPAPRERLHGLERFLSAEERARATTPTERLVMSAGGLTAVSALEVKRSDLTQPTGAVMLFARYIQEADIARVRATSQMPVSLIYLRAGPGGMERLPLPVRDWALNGARTARTLVRADDARRITAYTVISSADHTPVALFVTPSPRDIFALGYRATRTLLGTLATLIIAFVAAVAWLLLRLQRSFEAQQSAEARHHYISAQLHESIVLLDAESHEIIEVNERVRAALGWTLEELPRHRVQEIFPDIKSDALDQAVRSGVRCVLTSRGFSGAGQNDTEVAVTAMELLGRPMITLVGHDISHRREAEERERSGKRKLLRLAQHDPLTGLPNRMYLQSRLPQVLAKVAGSDKLLAVIYVDVDHFKDINDSRGHGSGDQLLQIIAQRLRAAVGAHDLVARMGGDEFIVVGSLLPNLEAAHHLAALLRAAVRAPVIIDGEPLTVTASLGLAVCPRDGNDLETLLKRADIALYSAKEAGRDCYRVFVGDMDVRVNEGVALAQALRHSLGTDQIYMVYQPIVDLRTSRMTSLEALMRWRHPELGMILPAHFIPAAEKTGLIVELGQQVLRLVLSQMREWLDSGVPIVPVAINVSTLQFDRTDFAAVVSKLAAEFGVAPSWLRFEITESAVIKETEKLIATLETLRALGSQVLIDDFGTGYSSLSYLNQLPISTLKIDRAFVRDLSPETARRSVINAVVDMASRLGLSTVAEGVETAEQQAVLRQLGCDFGQGYFYSKPVTARDCRALLEELRGEHSLTPTLVARSIS